MGLRVATGVGLSALIMTTAAAAQQGGAEAERNWADVAACGAIDDAERRLDCVDRVLQRAGVLSPERVEQAAREEFGRQVRPARTEAPRPAPAVAAPRRASDIDELVTSVASVRTVGYRRLRVTTAEGSVWDQTQAETFNTEPRPGDRFAVERASMGSFLCRFGSASRYRCERAD